MSDNISRLERMSSSASNSSVEMRSSIDQNSSSLIENFGIRESSMMIQENRKRRRNPFNFGGTDSNVGETENCVNSELPKSLRPENNVDDISTNPFLAQRNRDEPRIEIPKRRKNHW